MIQTLEVAHLDAPTYITVTTNERKKDFEVRFFRPNMGFPLPEIRGVYHSCLELDCWIVIRRVVGAIIRDQSTFSPSLRYIPDWDCPSGVEGQRLVDQSL